MTPTGDRHQDSGIAFMIDQPHNVEGTIDAMTQPVTNIQAAYAKASLVDEAPVGAAQAEGDVLFRLD